MCDTVPSRVTRRWSRRRFLTKTPYDSILGMDGLAPFLNTILGFLLQFVTLIVNFMISALTLFLDFFRQLVGLAS